MLRGKEEDCMSSIGGLNWTLTGDSTSFSKSVLMAKTDISAVKAALRETLSPVEQYRESFDRMSRGLKAAGVDAAQADVILQRMAQHSPAAVAAKQAEAAAQAEVNRQHREAAAILARHQTAQDRYNESVRQLAKLKAAGQFAGNEGAYRAEMDRLKETLPAIQAKRAAEKAAAVDAAARAADRQREVAARELAAKNVPAAPKAVGMRESLQGAVSQVPVVGKGLGMLVGANPMLTMGAAAAGYVGNEVRKTWNKSGDELQGLQEQGASGRKLGMDPQAYHQLAEAATRFGVANDTLYGGMSKLRKSIGDSVLGMGEGKAAYAALGLSATALAGMAPEKAFATVNEALQKQKDPATQAALAMRIYGESAGEILPLLKASKEQMAAITAEQQASGLLLSTEELSRIKMVKSAKKEADEAEKVSARQMIGLRAEWEIGKAKWDKQKAQVMGAVGRFLTSNSGGNAAGDAQDRWEAKQAEEAAGKKAAADAKSAAEAARRKKQMEEQQAAYKALNDSVRSFVSGLQMESETLGMTSRQAEIYKLTQAGMDRGYAEQQLRFAGQIEARKAALDVAKELQKQAATFGMTSEAAKNYELRQLGVVDSSMKVIVAWRNYNQLLVLQKELTDKSAEGFFKQAEAIEYNRVQQEQIGGVNRGGLDAKDASADKVAGLRREYEIRLLVWKLQQEGTPQGEIDRQVALRKQIQEYDRLAPAMERQKQLMDAARATQESNRTPEQIYADQVRNLNEQLAVAGNSFLPTYMRAKKKAADDMAAGNEQQNKALGDARATAESMRTPEQVYADRVRALNEQLKAAGDKFLPAYRAARKKAEEELNQVPSKRNDTVEATTWGSAAAIDQIRAIQAEMRGSQRAARIDAQLAKEPAGQPAAGAADQNWADKQKAANAEKAARIDAQLARDKAARPVPQPEAPRLPETASLPERPQAEAPRMPTRDAVQAGLDDYFGGSPRLPDQQSLTAPRLPDQQSLPAPRLPDQQSLTAPRLPEQQSLTAPRLPEQQSLTAPRLPEQQSLTAPRLPEQQSLTAPQLPDQQSLMAPRLPNWDAATRSLDDYFGTMQQLQETQRRARGSEVDPLVAREQEARGRDNQRDESAPEPNRAAWEKSLEYERRMADALDGMARNAPVISTAS